MELSFTPTSNGSDAYALWMVLKLFQCHLDYTLLWFTSSFNWSWSKNCLHLQWHNHGKLVEIEQILPKYDNGMLRNWDIDHNYIFGARHDIKLFNMSMEVLYTNHVLP